MQFVKPKDCKAKLVASKLLAPDVWSYFFELTEGEFEFKAGQFMNVKFKNPDNPEEILQRAYSFASAPNKNQFELCIELIEGGRGSRFFSGLNIGEEINFKTPFGFCNLDPDNHGPLLMVATGTGIAPMKSILEDLASREDDRRIDLFFGVRHEENLYYVDELNALNLKNLNIRYCLSQPLSDNWNGETGRVTDHLEDFDFSHNPEVFICGGEAMIKDVRNIVLEAGIDRKKIHVEIFDV